MSASSASLIVTEVELPPIPAETPALIPFAFDRLVAPDPVKPAVVLLRERDGERWLPIAVGPAETVALGEALVSAQPPAADETRAALIGGLVDGVFRAQIMTRGEAGVRSVPARPADALAEAIRFSLPIYVGSQVARLGCVYQAPEEERREASFAASVDHPIASFPYVRSARDRRWTPWAKGLCAILLMFIVAPVVVLPFAAQGGLKAVENCLTAMIPIAVFAVVAFRWALRFERSVNETVLEVSPAGLRWRTGDTFKLGVPWRFFADAGSLWRGVGWRDGLRFSQPIPVRIGRVGKIRMKGFPLAEFEPNWRTGELGQFVRLYAPSTLGVTPVDPEGGAVAF